MGIKNLVNKILYKLGLKQRPVLTKVEQWRARGVTIGKNFDGPDSAIDYCFGHLVTIGDNVTISGTTILAHDGSRSFRYLAADLICKPQKQLLRR